VTGGGKVALITGIGGQDGTYLTELLLEKGYAVHGIERSNSAQADHIGNSRDDARGNARVMVHQGDLGEATNLMGIVSQVRPDEIYNLAAPSHVPASFAAAANTINSAGLGTLRLLEAIRLLGLASHTRFYQASSSEMFGHAAESPQTETTVFQPRSPYGAAKLYAYWITVNYREAYGIHASNGILYNHESPLRGAGFVTRKISRGVAAIHHGLQECLHLGNLDASRDWGHARDYVRGMWLMLQQDTPGDYILATGESHTVREFVERAFALVDRRIVWSGAGAEEVGTDAQNGRVLVRVDLRHYRPAETHRLEGNPARARDRLGWHDETGFGALVEEMVRTDLENIAGSPP